MSSPDEWHYRLGIITAHDHENMIKGIQDKLADLGAEFDIVDLISISHDVLERAPGLWVWSALVVCKVSGKKRT